MDERKKLFAKLAALAMVACAVVAAAVHFDVTSITPEKIEDFVKSRGQYAIVVFLVIFTLRPLVVVFPLSACYVAGGVLFGPLVGGLCNFIGAALSAALGFVISRRLARDMAMRLVGERAAKLDALVKKEGFSIILYMRACVPYDVLSYAAGLTGMSFLSYAAATCVSIIPSSFAYAYLGDSFLKIHRFSDIFKPQVLLPILPMILVLFIPAILKRVIKPKGPTGGDIEAI